ncbi:hypothetical protein SAMN04488065_1238 [Haloplanus vescus]|uniref:DUF1684 domain-containing protein n=1 Tax=Haloplanus vescus TaxID=555874 RepID=A0A1H3WYI6_9EURY|nr:DUF1684 domain-containing protein [Haloplanus vescus]SDZ92257.1 hypothetical protein SAMN04488065_1238 [Haloplanus vescus]
MTDAPPEYAERLRENRAEKDRMFAERRGSPIPPEERDDFEGLDYFDPDLDYRVTATVSVHDDPDPVEMETSDGRTVRYLYVVTFEFDLRDDTHTLAGYRQRESDDDVFVPFRDKTTGQQTYRGGRYMELTPDRDLTDGDEVVLDFNLAYTPFCAFSDAFSCPLPPEENWLEIVVPAGERDPDW